MFDPTTARLLAKDSSRPTTRRDTRWSRPVLVLAIAAFCATAAAKDNRASTPAFSHAPAATQAMLAKAKPVTAKHAMVVTDQHLATQAGVEILT